MNSSELNEAPELRAMPRTHALGYFGNIWVRQNELKHAGEESLGHTHKFDHVSLLASGSVEVEIAGHPPKRFDAPTFIVIRKEYEHKFKALTDGVVWYCVFAIRDLDGQPIEDTFGVDHDPYSMAAVPNDYWAKQAALDAQTVQPSETTG